MQQAAKQKGFHRLSAEYFHKKADKVKGPHKLLVMLEMSKYLTAARENGLSFDELEQDGFRFATVPDIKN